MFPKRTRIELDWQKLQSLRLIKTNDGNWLTVDVDALRLDIAQSASEIEREWLYQLLAKRYFPPLPRKPWMSGSGPEHLHGRRAAAV